jgi:hypothetical protein
VQKRWVFNYRAGQEDGDQVERQELTCERARAHARGRTRAADGVLKHRWSVEHNFLSGLTTPDWWRLLRENRFAVDPIYWHRAAFITFISLFKSVYSRREEQRYGAAVANVELAGPPLFILGHWRSGTTHLHNLLAQDDHQFGFPNNYQVFSPRTFLSTEDWITRRFSALMPSRRPMDNMAVSFSTPQEDELALCLTTLRSEYLAMCFPRREEHYTRYLTLRGVPQHEVEKWKATLLWFLKKLTFKYGRPLLLKSPPHTGRIRLLIDLFPDARFVHIHRDPYALFQSLRHYYDTAPWYTYLQRPDRTDLDQRILRRHNILYDAFFEERQLIPEGQFHEVSYEELERDPVGQIRALYAGLGLAGFEEMETRLQGYLASIAGYEKNHLKELTADSRLKVAEAWQRNFEEWGYPA